MAARQIGAGDGGGQGSKEYIFLLHGSCNSIQCHLLIVLPVISEYRLKGELCRGHKAQHPDGEETSYSQPTQRPGDN